MKLKRKQKTVWITLGQPLAVMMYYHDITLGQPLAVMMYYHDFVVEHFGRDLITAYGQINSFNTSQPIIL